jgi:hypothetical protein
MSSANAPRRKRTDDVSKLPITSQLSRGGNGSLLLSDERCECCGAEIVELRHRLGSELLVGCAERLSLVGVEREELLQRVGRGFGRARCFPVNRPDLTPAQRSRVLGRRPR